MNLKLTYLTYFLGALLFGYSANAMAADGLSQAVEIEEVVVIASRIMRPWPRTVGR
jgi:hypothetical protein